MVGYPIWMWGIQLLLVNVHVLYKTTQLLIWHTNKSTIMSQYDFHKLIMLSWFDSETDQKWKRDDASVVMTNNYMGSSNKARRINEVNLDPLSGAL